MGFEDHSKETSLEDLANEETQEVKVPATEEVTEEPVTESAPETESTDKTE
jgi:hypothetical protein